MSEDWLKHINRTMADYETATDDSLWQKIEQKLPDNPRRKAAWIKPVCAILSGVAAITAIILSIAFLSRRSEVPQAIDSTFPIISDLPTPTATAPVSETGALPPQAIRIGTSFTQKEILLPDSTPAHIMAQIEEVADTQVVASKDTAVHIVRKPATASSYYAHNYRTNFQKQRARRKGSVTIAMYTSGSTTASSTSTIIADISGNDFNLGSNNVSWNDRPSLAIDMFNHGLDTEESIHHRIPIRGGLTVAYRFNQRMAIETGIVYTNLISDIKNGSELHYYSGTQRLHYIGIPLHFNFRIASWKKMDFYSVAGVTAAKCISGKTDNNYFIDGNYVLTETEKTKPHQIQWSLEANAGMQYNIIPSVGLYIEPGFGYYFKDGSQIRTVYKDHPLNFNLNLGLRFTIK